MTAAPRAAYFDAIYADDDPFGYRDRWYEARKRDLLLATLPQRRFARAWELGCSNGETTAELAARCDALLATDLNIRAVALARARTAHLAHVDVQQAQHPGQWPDGRFDLIVFAEVGYYLSPAELRDTATRLGTSLTDAGVLLACHWLAPFAQAQQTGRQVHRTLAREAGLQRMFRYRDADVLLEGWSRDGVSVAARDGLR